MAKFNLSSAPVLIQLKTWLTGLRNLNFNDNFRSFEWTGLINAASSVSIRHNLKVIPTRFIIISSRTGGTVTWDVNSPSSSDYAYLRNLHATEGFDGKILIMP